MAGNVDSNLFNDLLANAVLAACYILYKVVDRCMHSKCAYTQEDGLQFDIDGDDEGEECPATDMQKIADLLQSRAALHRGNTARV
jgi:hypothetical protein